MKFLSYADRGKNSVGIVADGKMYPAKGLSIAEVLAGKAIPVARAIRKDIRAGKIAPLKLSKKNILPPIADPPTFRDGYAFRQHVETARRNRGLGMVPEYDQFPVFYFSNPHAMLGPYADIACMPKHFDKLDFELEIAAVIGKGGRNIPAAEADKHITGFMVLNDVSARGLQMEEMKLNLGPAKGKDFAKVLGPWLVTPDELAARRVKPLKGHKGALYDLEMRAWINGELVSQGNMKSMHWTFAEIIQRASYGVNLYPGDLIGSGTVGTGCFLELNVGGKGRWLQPGDIIELEVEELGRQRNVIVRA